MNGPVVLLAGITLASSVICVTLAYPLARGWSRPGGWYGFRTRRTLADESVWQAVNQAAGRSLLATGFGLGLVSVLVMVFSGRLTVPNAGMLLAIAAAMTVIGPLMRGFSVQRDIDHSA